MRAIINIAGKVYPYFFPFDKGQQGTVIEFTVLDDNGAILDLSTYVATLKFKLTDGSESFLFYGTCTLSDPTNGQCTYTLQSNDLSMPGTFEAYLELTKSGVDEIISLGYSNVIESTHVTNPVVITPGMTTDDLPEGLTNKYWTNNFHGQKGINAGEPTVDTDVATKNYVDESVVSFSGALLAHENDFNNPHLVTKTQIGLGNVDNTSDVNKPISNATQSALDNKVPYTGAASDLNLGSHNILPNEVLFNTSPTVGTFAEGKVFWDSTNHCLAYHSNITGVTNQIGQETHVRVYNNSGSTITNGSVIYVSGANVNGLPEISLADSTTYTKSRVIGMMTADCATGTAGLATFAGVVNDLNTNSFNAGDTIYLSSTPGQLTNVFPTAGNFTIMLGIVIKKHATTGAIYVQPEVNPYTNESVTKTGWSNDHGPATLSFSNATRKVMLNPVSGTFHFYQEGVKYMKSYDEIQLPNTEGLYIVYYELGTLQYILNPNQGQVDTIIRHNPTVAYVYWDVTNQTAQYIGKELHSMEFAPLVHAYNHFVLGARYLTGLGLNTLNVDASGSLNSSAQFGVDAGGITDEDIYHATPSITSTTGLKVYYISGTSAAPTLRSYAANGYAVRTTGTGRLAYNFLTGGNWTVTEVSNGDFVLCHVFANNANTQSDRVFAFMGINQYTTLSNARAGALTEIMTLQASGIVPQELKSVATLVFETSNSYSNAVKGRVRSISATEQYVDWRVVNTTGGTVAGGATVTPAFSDSVFQIYNSIDASKVVNFSASLITGGTTRTLTVPDASGTIALTSTSDMLGPASSTDNAVTRFDGTTGKLVQNSLVTIDDSGSINIPTGQTYKINNVALAKGDVGLGNVDNTSDVNKPVSTAQQTAINGRVATTTTVNGHALSSNISISASDVGLGNVDNTSDLNKPISTATSTALSGKVATTTTVNGHALSSNVTVTKSDVGLGNVDNTADVNKAVLSATKLATARTISGQSFDGTANITIDHTGLGSIGTNTHAQIDTAITNSVAHLASTSNPHSTTGDQVLPSQGSNNGKFLTTNGSTCSWGTPSVSSIVGDVQYRQTFTAGENVSAGDVCYFKSSDQKMWKVSASAESTSAGLLSIATGTITANNTGTFHLFGDYTTTSLTAGSTYWLSTTSGAITTTRPSTAGQVSRIVGYALSTTVLKFIPDNMYITN